MYFKYLRQEALCIFYVENKYLRQFMKNKSSSLRNDSFRVTINTTDLNREEQSMRDSKHHKQLTDIFHWQQKTEREILKTWFLPEPASQCTQQDLALPRISGISLCPLSPHPYTPVCEAAAPGLFTSEGSCLCSRNVSRYGLQEARPVCGNRRTTLLVCCPEKWPVFSRTECDGKEITCVMWWAPRMPRGCLESAGPDSIPLIYKEK